MGRSSEVSASICDGSVVWDQNGTHRERPDGRAEVCKCVRGLLCRRPSHAVGGAPPLWGDETVA